MPQSALVERIDALKSEVEAIDRKIDAFIADISEWRKVADELIEQNRCTDRALQGALIQMGEDRLFRMELAKHISRWRQRLNVLSAAVLGALGTATAILGYLEWGQ